MAELPPIQIGVTSADVTFVSHPYTLENGETIVLSLPLIVSQHDSRLIDLWLNNKSLKSQQAYVREIVRFYRIVQKPVQQILIDDFSLFVKHPEIARLRPSSQARALAVIKSLLTYASNAAVGLLPVNVGQAVKLPKMEDTLAERIMSEQSIDEMIRLEPNPKYQLMLELLYFGALRVEELCNLKWRHLQERDQTGQMAVYGKGKKTRYILLDSDTWAHVWRLRSTSSRSGPEDYVFSSRQAKKRLLDDGTQMRDYRLDESRVHQIVRAAADRAGIARGRVSPHWLRHAHATHALDNGEPISLVQQMLGHKSVATTGRYLHVRPHTSTAFGLRAAQKKRSEQRP
jgi:integrase/recombinase XerD